MGTGVPSREYYLQQAKLLFDMAATSTDREMVARLVERANGYLLLAESMPEDEQSRPHESAPIQRQPMQQQMQKATDDSSEPQADDS